VADNLAALDALAAAEAEGRPPTPVEREALGRWHGWGAAPQVFDRPEFAAERDELRERLGPAGFNAAARTTLNAHYTDPRTVEAIWATVDALGVSGGLALEPGCGRGSFLAAAPAGWRVLGVELDPATARVAQALADARHAVVAGDFATVRLEPGRAQAVVGNVPFGNYALFDPEHNPQRRLSIHDHFLLKATTALAPGGVAVVVTSRFSLDKLDPTARAAIGERADFLGAVRLPDTAHRAEAGTTAVTDIVVLRARPDGTSARHAAGWDDGPVEVTSWDGRPLAEPVRISRYFLEHPAQIVGRVDVGHGMYRVDLRVAGDGVDLDTALAAALTRIAHTAPATVSAPPAVAARDPRALLAVETSREGPVGRIERSASGVFRRLGHVGWQPHDPRGRRDELAALIELRDTAAQVVDLEARHGVSDELLDDTRRRLRATYDAYVQRWGPVNRVKISDTGRRTYPRMGGFRTDPGWPRVASLEVYDEALGQAAPASILERRMVRPVEAPETADGPEDALAISLQRTGQVDPAYIAALLQTDPAEALAALGDRVYLDPARDRWVTAEEYLSGNVRAKLARAQAEIGERPELARNVDALQAAVPRDVTADELQGVLGAPWVDVALVEEFARDLCPDPELAGRISVARTDSTGAWVINAPDSVRYRMSEDHEFGLARMDALRLLEDGLNGRAPVIARTVDGQRVVDAAATAQAADLAESLRDRFDAWLLTDDPDRSARALRVFNDRFNAHVPRSYTQAADAVSPDGLRSDFVLRPQQGQAIARMVYGGDTLLAHPVGAGKTAEMIVGAMELRRLGTIHRPCFVVPNHMLGQFSADIVALYPGAEVLAINKDQLTARHRTELAARVQTHDWDAVVITHSTFTRWPLSPDVATTALLAKTADLRAELQRLTDLDSPAAETLTKRIEKRLAAYEESLKENDARKSELQDDHAFFFDQSGIDYLCLDEAHEFKNAEVVSNARNLRGVPVGPGSLRAEDLDAKLAWLRDAHPGRPVATMATATPIANTVAELWIMARYLGPQLLDDLHVSAFDSFRAMFADTTSAMELDTSGTRYRRVERLARYKNLPELARLWGELVDVVTVDQLDLPRPAIEGGHRQLVLVEPSPQLAHFITTTVAERADAIQRRLVEPSEDNFLKLTSDARIASFDWQTYADEPVDAQHSTLVAAAERIAEIHHATTGRTYRTATGHPHPRPGALQLVFSDLGTPKPGRDDTAYDRLRRLLVDRGVPADKVAFAHEHDTSDDAKARFFAACRDGRVAVAVSSTSKMGMGTNVQDRLIALHHLDCPWRPVDIEQREGRIVRQGNQHDTVAIYAYASERSFAVHGWQTLERKAGFIGQIMRVDPSGPRSLEPDDTEALSYGQVKALATGDPDFLRVAELEDQLARLERIQRSHHNENAALTRRHTRLTTTIDHTQAEIAQLRPIASALAAIDDLVIDVAGERLTNRGDIARALQPLLQHHPRTVITFPDIDGLHVRWAPAGGSGWLEIDSIGASAHVTDRTTSRLVGSITKLANAINAIPDRVQHLEHVRLPDLQSQLERTEAKAGGPFPRADELRATRAQLDDLHATLQDRYSDPTPSPHTTPPNPATAIDTNLGVAINELRNAEAALDHRAPSPIAGPPTPEHTTSAEPELG
jgi:N12 class adenine-specific DNA methylase